MSTNDSDRIGFLREAFAAPGLMVSAIPGISVRWRWLQVLALAALGIVFAAWLRPEPFSDWEYYWQAAGNPRDYLRGGVALWLLAIPKAFGLTPWKAALLINLPAMLWVWWLAHHVDRSKYRLFALLVWMYLVLLTPYLAVVQFDLFAASMLATAVWLAFADHPVEGRRRRDVIAVILIACASSSRTQFALVLLSLVGMSGVAWLLLKRRPSAMLRILTLLFVGALLGFALDAGMRQVSGRSQEVRTGLAVTVYSGLLVSSDRAGARCGGWTPAAVVAAQEDVDMPLHTAILDRLAAKEPHYWASVVVCKSKEIVFPSAYASYWLFASPNVLARRGASSPDSCLRTHMAWVTKTEQRLYGLVRNLILTACFMVTGICLRRARALALLPVLWLASFWGVHAVLEVQGRYFLGMLLLAPVFCALIWHRDTPTATVEPAAAS